MVVLDALEATADSVLVAVRGAGIFGFDGQTSKEFGTQDTSRAPAFTLQHRDLETIEHIFLREIEAAVVVVRLEPSPLSLNAKERVPVADCLGDGFARRGMKLSASRLQTEVSLRAQRPTLRKEALCRRI